MTAPVLQPQPKSWIRHSVDLIKRPLFGSVALTEFPKSGGTWVGQMLSAATGLPFVRHHTPPSQRYLMHKHALPGLRTGRAPVVLLRDGRDALVSFYFHLRYLKDGLEGDLAQRFAQAFPDEAADHRVEMPAFLELMLTHPLYPRFTWQEFAMAWYAHPKATVVSYEDMQRDPCNTLTHLAQHLGATPYPSEVSRIVDQFSFARQTGDREPGQEDRTSFHRKGIVGDWRTYFSRQAAEVFDRHAGEALVALGYEPDRSWVERVPA